jgi:hypothetical protein
MNKYRVVYGYCHPHAMLTHLTRTKICNSFDEAKNFINNLPKTSFRIGDKDCKCSNFSGLGKEPSNLYAKIRCEGKDFWIFGNPNEIWMRKGYIGSNNPYKE